jgi:MFS family permease
MKRKRFSKEVWIVILIDFLKGIEFTGLILVPFFTDWGGVDQFQIQLLQSWFTLNVFLWEIPTGLFGDTKGLKYSVVMGHILYIAGILVYASIPNIWIFALGELILAVGTAFESGAKEAFLYETMKDNKEEKQYNDAVAFSGNMHLTAMIIASVIGGFLLPHMSLNHLFLLGVAPRIVAFVLALIFLKEPSVEQKKELAPDYKEIFKSAFRGLKNDKYLQKTAVFTTIVYGVSYFVLWFYQPLLKNLGVLNEELGVYRIILIVSEMLFLTVAVWAIGKFKKKRNIINIILVLLVAAGFFTAAFWNNISGVVVFIILSGGIGLNSRDIFSKTLNDRIESKQRATSLSAISMLSRIFLAVSNIIFGYLSDINLNMTVGILGLILLIGGIIFVPRD